jgi:hypothetical protein
MKAMRWFIAVLLLGYVGTAQANGDGRRPPVVKKSPPKTKIVKDCRPIRTNTFTPLFHPVPVPGLNTEFGKFEPWPLTPEQTKIGFVAKRTADSAYLVIPNSVHPRLIAWIKLVSRTRKKEVVCASRIVVTFESEADTSSLAPLVSAVRGADANAQFLRPIMQNVQVEWTVPFLGLLHRFDPRPTFPLGGVVMVWDIDRRNTQILEDFIQNAGPSADLPGIIMMREMYTGLLFSISLALSGERLLENRVVVPISN